MAAEDYFDFDAWPDEEFEDDGSDRPTSRHGFTWSMGEDNALRDEANIGIGLKRIAERHKRTENAILARMCSMSIGEGRYWVRNRSVQGPAYIRVQPFGMFRETTPGTPATWPAKSYFADFSNIEQRVLATMNAKDNLLLTLLQQDYTTLSVAFQTPSGGLTHLYTYKVSNEVAKTLKPGDQIVVPAGEGDRLKVVTVKEVHDEPQIDVTAPYALKWIVQKVDRAAYDEQVKREAEALSLLVKAQRAAARRKAAEAIVAGGDPDLMKKVQDLLSGRAPEIPE